MENVLDFESNTYLDRSASGPQVRSNNVLVTRTSPRLAVFRHFVRRLIAAQGSEKAVCREDVLGRIVAAPTPKMYVSELLSVCTTHGHADRLDAAIDVLSKTDALVFDYAWDYLISDIQQWSHQYSDRAYRPNDDYWYILLRAVARCDVPREARFRFIVACSSAVSRGVMEGVVEALGDLGSEEAKIMLRRMSSTHDDPFIRELSQDVLDDLEQ